MIKILSTNNPNKAEITNHVSAFSIWIISNLYWIRQYIIRLLVAITNAPNTTRIDLNFQRISTRCPKGILRTHGRPAQKPNPARKTADKSKYSLTKNRPTILVIPDTPAAR